MASSVDGHDVHDPGVHTEGIKIGFAELRELPVYA